MFEITMTATAVLFLAVSLFLAGVLDDSLRELKEIKQAKRRESMANHPSNWRKKNDA